MKSILKWFLCLGLIVTSNVLLQAQDGRDSLWVIETVDDNEYVGKIIYRDNDVVKMKTLKIGIITIQMKDIKSIERVKTEQMVNGEFWFENPHATRYFWAPNGYGLRRGEGYYQNTWIFLNQVSYGVTDNVTIGVGLIPLFIFALDDISTPFWVTPKVSIPIREDKFNVGVGAIAGGVLGEDTDVVGIVYGTATIGSRDKNFSFSLGYGFTGNDWADAPTITLSGMIRTGKRGFFITENYFIRSGGTTFAIISAGGRYIFKKLALDFGGFIPVVSDQAVLGPWLGVNVPFGNKINVD